MFKKAIKFSHFELFLLFFKVQNDPDFNIDDIRFQAAQNQDLLLVHKDKQKVLKYQKQIKKQISSCYLQIYSEVSFDPSTNKQFNQLKSQYEITIVTQSDFEDIHQQIKKKGYRKAYAKINDKIKYLKDPLIYIIEKQFRNQFSQRLKQIKQPFDLQLTSKKVIILALINFFDKLKQMNIQIIEKNNTIYALGNKSNCIIFKSDIQNEFKSISTKVISVKFNYMIQPVIKQAKQVIKDKMTKVFMFKKKNIQQICNYMSQKYQIDGPSIVYEKEYKNKQNFILYICQKKDQQTLEEIFNEIAQKQEIIPVEREKTILASRKIQKKYYSEQSIKEWLNKKIQWKNIKINQFNNKEQIQITLLGFQDKQDQIVEFNKYFEFQKFIFFKDQINEIITIGYERLKQRYTDIIIYIREGYSPYKYYEFINNETIKKNLENDISKSTNITKSIKNIHKFQCIYLKGVKIILDMAQLFLQDTLKQIEKQRCKIQVWKLQLPNTLIQNINNKKVVQLITLKITNMSMKLPQFLILLTHKFQQQGIVCQIKISHKNTNQNIEKPKKQFIESLSHSFQQLKLDYNIKLKQLKQIIDIDAYTDVACIQKQDGIYYVGFQKTVSVQLTKTRNILKASKSQDSITINLSIYSILKDYIQSIKSKQNLKIEIKINNNVCITIKGLKIIVQNTMTQIKKKIQQVQQQFAYQKIRINKREYQMLNQNFIKIHKEKFLVETNFKLDKDVRDNHIKFKNNNSIIISRYNILQSFASVRLLRNQNDLEMVRYKNGVNLDLKELKNSPNTQHRILILNNMTIREQLNFFKINLNFPSIGFYLQKLAIQQELQQIFQYLSQKQQQPVIIISARDQNQFNIMNFIVSMKKNNNQIIQKKTHTSKWYWYDIVGKVAFNDKSNDKINESLRNNNHLTILNQQDLEIVQTNAKFYKKEQVIINLKQKKKFDVVKRDQNYFYIIDGKEYKISSKQQKKINSANTNEVQINLACYEINTNTLIQKNLFTKYQRKIHQEKDDKLQIIQLKYDFVNQQMNENWILELSTHEQQQKNLIQYKHNLMLELNKYYRECQSQIKINLKIMNQRELHILLLDTCVKIKTCEKQNQIYLKIVLQSYEAKAIEQFKMKYNYKVLEHDSKIQIPQYWTNISEQIALIQIPKNTSEFLKIQKAFKNKIKKLVRIQNIHLWRKYYAQKKDIQKRSGITVKQAFLFHGTSTTNPSIIYNNKQQSFNINYSSESNFFGRGIYFAQQSKYSQRYAYKAQYSKIMLYCRVQIGQSQKIDVKNKDETRKDTLIRDKEKNIRYQSIHSYYGQSDIYIVYKSRRAYPAYEITY